MFFKFSSYTIIQIGPSVVRLHEKGVSIQNGKSVNDVRAELAVDVLGLVLANALSVPCPIGEVANHLVLVISSQLNLVINYIVCFP